MMATSILLEAKVLPLYLLCYVIARPCLPTHAPLSSPTLLPHLRGGDKLVSFGADEFGVVQT